MKRIFLLCVIIFILQGNADAITLSAPANGSVNVTCKPLLSWKPFVNTGNSNVRYDLYLDDQSVPVKKVAAGIRDTSYVSTLYAPYKTYYWKIVAMDGINQIDQSPVYSFTPWQAPLQPLTVTQVELPEGTYAMGNSSYKIVLPGLGIGPVEGTYPQHTVTLGGFSIGKYEITYEQYAQFLNSIKSNLRIDVVSNGVYFLQPGHKEILLCDIKADASAFDVKKHSQLEWSGTVVNVRAGFEQYPMSWMYYDGAYFFADWVGCRLPTEAEWEYAAKGGSQSMGYEYSGTASYDQAGWYIWNSKNVNNPISGFGAGVPARDGRGTHPVGQKLPNEIGIYDMSGNVTEFCSDFYNVNQYAYMESLVPQGPVDSVVNIYHTPAGHVMRGGSWDDLASHSMVTFREQELSQYMHKEAAGFRIVGDNPTNSRYYVQGVVRDEWGNVISDVHVKSTSGTAVSEVTGRYVLRLSAGSNGSITPEKEGYEFSPAVIYINDLDEHRTELNFIAYLKREHTISGIITDQSSNPLSNVSIKGLPGKITTDQNGYYTVSVPDGASYTLNPELSGYIFQSLPYVVTNLHADLTADFSAAYVGTVTISGRVRRMYNGTAISTENNVSITGLPDPVLAFGTYSYQVTKGWSGVLKAVKGNYYFLPEEVAITNIQTDLQQDFDYMSTSGADKTVSGVVRDSRGDPLEGVEIKGFL